MESCFVAGADPELMITSPEGQLISSIGLVPGTKKRPRKVPGGAIQHDNVMAEFNVNPSRDSEEFIGNIRSVLRELHKVVRPNRLVVQASAEFPEPALKHPKARVFGCDPDFDAWRLAMNEIDGSAAFTPFRSAGGHFHVGKTPELVEMLDDPYGKIEVVKMLDIFLGIPSVILDLDPTAPARRRLYGKAGAHRPKSYGVEYRALGNFWVRSPQLTELIFQLADIAVRLTHAGESHKLCEAIGVERICTIINESQTKEAVKVVRQNLAQYLPEEVVANILSQTPSKEVEGQELYQAWEI